jgi:predicted Zn-dependent protease
MRISTFAFVTALALGLGPACTTESGAPLFISEQQEVQVGKQVHADILDEFGGACVEPQCPAALQQYVQQLGQDIASRSSRPKLKYTFTILHTDQINAFAAPGGFIYLTTGLMRQAKDKSEVAGVLAHEVGHVALYHGANAIQRQATAQLLNDLILGEDSAAGQIAATVFNGYEAFVQSPDQELDADTQGVLLSHAAGYTPGGLVDFFQLLHDLESTQDPLSAAIGRVLSTHPPSDERISHATEVMAKNGIDPGNPALAVDGEPPYAQILGMLPPPKGDQNTSM